tara:strand:- start:1410 stop:2249 length:840 start_codon:yes stop_codon:yes gene_type:complete
MAKDYTKYQVDGIDGNFGKGKLVLAVVQNYCSKNECTFNELKQVFPDKSQGGITGVFSHIEEAKEIAKKRARHYVKDPIAIKDATIAVSTQWGTQIGDFISKAEEVGYSISTVEGGANTNVEESTEKTSQSNYDNFLTMPIPKDCTIEWNPKWGHEISIQLDNDWEVIDDCDNFGITLVPSDKVILGKKKSEVIDDDEFDDKWFLGPAALSEYNQEEYIGGLTIYIDDEMVYSQEEGIAPETDEGQEILDAIGGADKLLEILNGKLISKIYNHIKNQNT